MEVKSSLWILCLDPESFFRIQSHEDSQGSCVPHQINPFWVFHTHAHFFYLYTFATVALFSGHHWHDKSLNITQRPSERRACSPHRLALLNMHTRYSRYYSSSAKGQYISLLLITVQEHLESIQQQLQSNTVRTPSCCPSPSQLREGYKWKQYSTNKTKQH